MPVIATDVTVAYFVCLSVCHCHNRGALLKSLIGTKYQHSGALYIFERRRSPPNVVDPGVT